LYYPELINWYETISKKYNFNIVGKTVLKHITGGCHRQVVLIERSVAPYVNGPYPSKLDLYDFVLFIRLDLLLKPHFCKVFDANWNTIRFPFAVKWQRFWEDNIAVKRDDAQNILYREACKQEAFPVITDPLWYVPKKYFGKLFRVPMYVLPWHDGWRQLVARFGLSHRDIDTMIDTYHSWNCQFGQNPLYQMNSRPIGPVTHNKHRFDKYTSPW